MTSFGVSMLCPSCGNKTKVTNTRLAKNLPRELRQSTRRSHKCLTCAKITTTLELEETVVRSLLKSSSRTES